MLSNDGAKTYPSVLLIKMADFLDADESRRWSACITDAEEGSSPLDIYTASNLGDEQVVKEAIQSDPGQATVRNELGWSPLMFAVWQGHKSLVLLFLQAATRSGQDADDPLLNRLPRSGRTLLMVAARFGYLEIARMLCKGAAPETRDFRGQTALFHAVRGGSHDVVRFLVAQGANVNACSQGESVLQLAGRCGAMGIAKFLRDAGAVLEVQALPRRMNHATASAQDGLSLAAILEGISLQKYLVLFQLHNIDLNGFLAMNEEDLRHIGVSLLGPRRRMAMEIDRLRTLFKKS